MRGKIKVKTTKCKVKFRGAQTYKSSMKKFNKMDKKFKNIYK